MDKIKLKILSTYYTSCGGQLKYGREELMAQQLQDGEKE
jgi:hypothetical protein